MSHHDSTTDARRARHRSSFSLIKTLNGILVVLVAICLGVLSTGGTYAYLTSNIAVPVTGAGTTSVAISSGTSGLVLVNAPGNFPAASFYPGITQKLDFSVSATGTANLALSVASITGQGTNSLVVRVASGTCSGAAAGVAYGPLGVIAVAPIVYDSVNTPASVVPLCLIVAMPTTAPADAANNSTAIAAQISGVQP